MADHNLDKGDRAPPKEIFELDQDERWQARLDEARARREVALAEKAAGKPQPKRRKPWEEDEDGGPSAATNKRADIVSPVPIEPIIQERGDDKFDFADRLESIRGAGSGKKTAPGEMSSGQNVGVADHQHRELFEDAHKAADVPASLTLASENSEILPSPNGLEPRARPQPSLVLPGAPDVAEIAARYATSVDAAATWQEDQATDAPASELEQLLDSEKVPETADDIQGIASAPVFSTRRSERRRGIRPLGMGFGLAIIAMLPFTTQAPPLEIGPAAPQVEVFHVKPALGVTWSLSNRPVETSSGDWRPAPIPVRPDVQLAPQSAPDFDQINLLQPPLIDGNAGLDWQRLERSFSRESSDLYRLEKVSNLPQIDTLGPSDQIRVQLSSETIGRPPVKPVSVLTASRGEDARTNSDITDARAVMSNPLRITILSPLRIDQRYAESLASNIRQDGHQVAPVQLTNTSISSMNLRFFYEPDREAAESLAKRYGAELRDFTGYRPLPPGGTVELWLSNDFPKGSAEVMTLETLGEVLVRFSAGIGSVSARPRPQPGSQN